MSGFTDSLSRVAFLALIIQIALAPTLTVNWTGREETWRLAQGRRRLLEMVEVGWLVGCCNRCWLWQQHPSLLYSCVGMVEFISYSDGLLHIKYLYYYSIS